MNKAEKKLIRYAVAAIFVLLFVLLGTINGINFTMAAEDADQLTLRLSEGQGRFEAGMAQIQENPARDRSFYGRPGQFGPMGPDAPDMNASLRYFTCKIEGDEVQVISYNISAVTEEEAASWAASLTGRTTGWTHGTYRYRVYEIDGTIFVTVIDQGREMISVYRILWFSLAGAAVGVILACLVLRAAGKKVFAPVEEADRKQKQFIAQAEKAFKLPLTVINAETELLERANGSLEETRAIHRQVNKMDALVRSLGRLAVFTDREQKKETVDLSAMLQEEAEERQKAFEEKGILLNVTCQEGILVTADPGALRQVIDELFRNAEAYALQKTDFRLTKEGERIRLTTENDTSLPDGEMNQVFDRFTVLSNSMEGNAGLGLSYVKEIIKDLNGRVSAAVADGIYQLNIDL